jgi:hypothetical protein
MVPAPKRPAFYSRAPKRRVPASHINADSQIYVVHGRDHEPRDQLVLAR